jgi:hypothetical protein
MLFFKYLGLCIQRKLFPKILQYSLIIPISPLTSCICLSNENLYIVGLKEFVTNVWVVIQFKRFNILYCQFPGLGKFLFY